MEKFEEIKALIEACNEDVDKFYVKGNKAAAVRIRKTMQDIKNLILIMEWMFCWKNIN